jgi:hypothetical protein
MSAQPPCCRTPHTCVLLASAQPCTTWTKHTRPPPARWMHLGVPGLRGSASSWRTKFGSVLGAQTRWSSHRSNRKHCAALNRDRVLESLQHTTGGRAQQPSSVGMGQ